MKRILFIFSVTVFLLTLFSFFPVHRALAQQQDKTVIVSKNEIINHDYFAAGNTVIINGTVNGDVYAAGGTIFVDGVITGDVLAAGGNITIKGTVHNIRVAGGNITVDGKVLGNVSAAGGNITVGSSAHVNGSIVSAGGQINLLGPVDKDVYLAGGNIMIGNITSGQVTAAAGRLTLSPQAAIKGPLTFYSKNSATIAQGAVIGGKITHNYPPKRPQHNPQNTLKFFAGLLLFWEIAKFLLTFAVGILLIQCMPIYTEKLTSIVQKRAWPSLGIGFLMLIATPIAFILLAITIIGIPLAILWIFSMAIIGYIGHIIISLVIGKWLLMKLHKKQNHSVWALFFGLLFVTIVSFFPILGGIFKFIIATIGLGAVLIMKKEFYGDLRSKKLI